LSEHYQSWGRFPHAQQQRTYKLYWASDPIPAAGPCEPMLPYGCGRSYGDVCLNDGGVILDVRGMDRFLAFDPLTGRLRCEAGVTLDEVLRVMVRQRWFLPVTPGTKFVTLGGAVANDVHGKNHHVAGTFGRHTLGFELLRSTGERMWCSRDSNVEWFEATIGGLGLTGLITVVELQLKPVRSRRIAMEAIKFGGLDEFFAISRESEYGYEYTVSWADCVAKGSSMGRGIFMRGNHVDNAEALDGASNRQRSIPIPVDFPGFTLNPLTIRLFNALYYHKQLSRRVRTAVDYEPFFYPLDAVLNWNRIYGKRGFLQWQCVAPHDRDTGAIHEIFRVIAAAGTGSFLAILKVFGSLPSPGLMSFPKPGVTLALDFRLEGERTFRLLDRLDDILASAGGRLYPAKDARMSPRHFQLFYPQWERFANYIDPAFSSSFWRRVTAVNG
jgi:FAD/FMN-containing dehydrogenase